MKKGLTLLSAFLFVGVLLTGCSSGDNNATTDTAPTPAATGFRTVDEIKQSGTVTIGVFSDKAPFGFIDASGSYDGYDVYFGNRIGQDLGVQVQYVPLDAAARVDSLVANKVDIVLANFTVTDERAEKVDFALPYQKVQLGIVSPTKASITTTADLKGKKLAIVKGTTAETYFEKNNPEIELLKYDQYADVQQALLDGRGAAWATDNTEAWSFANDNKDYSVPDSVNAIGDKDSIAPAVAKGNSTLLEWINTEIKTLATEKFFHADYDAELATVYGADNADTVVVEGGVI
jgi:polar amino acid transport system substrate-binding protein